MSLADLTLARWRSFDASAAHRLAREAADLVDGRVVAVETVEQLGGPLHRVCVERGGRRFALVPGGPVSLGFDPDRWTSAPGQEADYARSAEQGYGRGPDLRAHLALELSPARTAVLPAVLMAVEDEGVEDRVADSLAELPGALAVEGLRLPSADEWEHGCGAGAGTLFRWGDDCPLDRDPCGDPSGPHQGLNAFGLRIAYDTYRAELSTDPGSVHGGDGGESVCGGYGALLGWLPLATAHRNAAMAEFVRGPEGEDVGDGLSLRPVLDL
ncbi:hypothetical protein [Streptomyces lichenis]|uniref:Uncharacterized protein n=1 Tax=Streptomyces lichenis TaxID=2306967 RepID=A0ABT0ICN2_9ACTN|nr:hypothetical protein [Streptomyces lichenis]MCK8679088.1 hypothetical protein [Streptomyces lichenis]